MYLTDDTQTRYRNCYDLYIQMSRSRCRLPDSVLKATEFHVIKSAALNDSRFMSVVNKLRTISTVYLSNLQRKICSFAYRQHSESSHWSTRTKPFVNL